MAKGKYIIYVSMLIVLFMTSIFGITYSSLVNKDDNNTNKEILVNTIYGNGSLINFSFDNTINDNMREKDAYKNRFTINLTNKRRSCYTVSLVVDKIDKNYSNRFFKYELFNISSGTSESGIGNFEGIENGSEILLVNNKLLIDSVVYEVRLWNSDTESDKLNRETILSAHIVVNSKIC